MLGTKGSIQQEDIKIILKRYASSNIMSKNTRQKLSELNGKINLQSAIGKAEKKPVESEKTVNKCHLSYINITMYSSD